MCPSFHFLFWGYDQLELLHDALCERTVLLSLQLSSGLMRIACSSQLEERWRNVHYTIAQCEQSPFNISWDWLSGYPVLWTSCTGSGGPQPLS